MFYAPVAFEEFLEFEEDAELEHELVDGFIYPWESLQTYLIVHQQRRVVDAIY